MKSCRFLYVSQQIDEVGFVMSMLMALMLDDNAMVDMITDQAEPMPEAEAEPEPEDCAFSDEAWSICNTACRK